MPVFVTVNLQYSTSNMQRRLLSISYRIAWLLDPHVLLFNQQLHKILSFQTSGYFTPTFMQCYPTLSYFCNTYKGTHFSLLLFSFTKL